MAPRAKAVVLHRPVESESEPDFDSFDATANASTIRESLPQKKGGREVDQQGLPNNPNPQSVAKGKGKSAQDGDETALLERQENIAQHPPKPRGRPKAASSIDNKGGTNSTAIKGVTTKVSPKIDEIPETQPLDLMAIDEGPRDQDNHGEPRMHGIENGLNSESTTKDLDIISLHRRIGDLTRKHENLQTRYRDLQDIGVKAAERNFERLRKQTEDNTAAANKLMSLLKEELVTKSKIQEQAELLQQQLELSQAETNDLRTKLINAGDALSEAKCEIKTMSAKLAASRTNETNIKSSNNSSKPTAAGNRAYQETIQVAQAKEDLYGDLTGLIVRDIKRGEKEDIFDCIQTGRNGSLHFKLALEKANGNDNYEDVQFTYRPQLDANRDSEVIEVLPEYLTEEITFPRPHSSKFYTRVTKALTERME
ncbi:Monopolin complex subunit pcs1 [Cladobotryum mycophilum]|uniref:Monopolin complex subunit pcs1 n=1 Tax=Cladobotryum mycophilum TaxID=491253 RepID=A0ABR0T1S6_9HYPO